jgi:hypothetical protein
MNLKSYYKVLYLIGIFMSLLSLFFEWYSFQARNFEDELVVLWNYYLFLGWTTVFSPDAWFNEVFKPKGEQLPTIIGIVYILVMIITIYSVLFKDLEHTDNLKSSKKYSYVHIFQLFLSGFYISIVPIYYWISQEFFFPYLVFTNFDLEVRFTYTIGLGYILQCFAFTAIFPYSIYYYYTCSHFKNNLGKTTLQEILNQVQESIDFEKLIVEEKLKLQMENDEEQLIRPSELEVNNMYTKFLKLRGVK